MLFAETYSWILTLLVGLLTYYLVKTYLAIRHLPPGPFPLPIFGNLLSFRKKKTSDVLKKYRKEYGDIYTIWLGNLPFVIVCGLSQIKEAMLQHRNDFAGRASLRSIQIFLDGNTNIGDSDFGKPWDTLRKTANIAVRNYAVSEAYPSLVDEVTQELVKNMLLEKAPFDPKEHLYLSLSNIIASAVLGKRYKSDDPEFLKFRRTAETFNEEFGNGFISDFLPFMSIFNKQSETNLRTATHETIAMTLEKFKQHETSYEKGDIRDIMDSLLAAREESINEGKENAVYMSDINMAYAIFDLYFAGVETTTITLRWTLMFLTANPDKQKKVIEEIQDNIGDRMPVQDDRKICPFTMAVIYEALRLRAATPLTLPHKAICNSQIAGYFIPKSTVVITYADAVHKDSEHWDEPEKFMPERFLDSDGHFMDSKLDAFMPFGKGRRSCIGEKLAIFQLFLILAGIFRKCQLEMKEPPENMEPIDMLLFAFPKPYKIIATPIS